MYKNIIIIKYHKGGIGLHNPVNSRNVTYFQVKQEKVVWIVS